MRSGEQKIARAYVLYREEHRKARDSKKSTTSVESELLHITLNDGSRVPLDLDSLSFSVNEACADLNDVTPDKIINDVKRNLYDGVTVSDVNRALILSARTLIEIEPNYSFVTARLLLNDLRNEAFDFLHLEKCNTQADMATMYPSYFKQYIERGIALDRLDPALQAFDLDKLGQALDASRDLQFTYLGLQTLYDRYFIHYEGTRYELPQAFFMRIAMGLAVKEQNKEERAIEFYDLISSFDYMTATPTLFNSGTIRPQLSSCYLSTISDDLEGIFGAIKDNALLSKFAGGLGNDWTPVRASGSHIQGTNGLSQGPIPFMVVANATLVAVNQGGKRKGAGCGYLETFHKGYRIFFGVAQKYR